MAGRFPRGELGLIATAASIVFVRVFGLSLVLPGFRAYGDTLTSSSLLVGTALGAYGLTMALMQLPLGILSDRIGRRPVLLLGTGLFVMGSILCAVAPTIETLILARLLQGSGAIASVAMAAVGETVPTERRTTAMAMVGIPAGVGFLLGFAAGPALEPLVGMQGLFLGTAALGLLAGLPALRVGLAPIPEGVAPGILRSLTAPVLSLAVAGFTVNYALTTTIFFLPDPRPLVIAGMLATALAVMSIATRIIDHSGLTWQPIVAALVAVAAGAALHVEADALVLLLLGGVVFFAAHSVLSAVLPSQVSRLAGRSGGRGHGIQNVVASMGTFAAGPVAGAFAGHPAWALGVLALLAGATSAFVAMAGRRVGPVPAAVPAGA